MRNEHKIFRSHDDVLEQLAKTLDITEEQYELAVSRYHSIGEWLDREESSLAIYSPEISPQGSFLLGTVVRPTLDTDAFDLDLVCRINASKTDFTQKELKEAVGKEVVAYAKAKNLKNTPEDKRRCWTLEYRDKVSFHMDVLPALPDAKRFREALALEGYRNIAMDAALTEQALAITDDQHTSYAVTSDDWPVSNPFGYAAWFKQQMKVRLVEAKRAFMAENIALASIEDVPDHKVRTPLQRAIQLLKRHRDMVHGDDEDKPISIIITTLSAHAYRNEESLSDALTTILTTMDQYIGPAGSGARIPNPVNPKEDFADKWAETPRKEKLFREWLGLARQDFGAYVRGRAFSDIPQTLKSRIGDRLVEGALAGLIAAAVASPAIARTSEHLSADRLDDVAARIQSSGGSTKPWALDR